MPNIRTYEAQDVRLTPDERGMAAINREAAAQGQIAGAQESLARSDIEGGQARARAIASIGQNLGGTIQSVGNDYVKWKTHQQVSQGAASMATISNDLSRSWNDTARQAWEADPNDATVGPKFREKTLEPTLQKFVDGFDTEEGRQWAQQQANTVRQHFFERIAADEGTRSKMAVSRNIDVLGNQAESAVMADPSDHNIDLQIGLLRSGVSGIVSSAPNLSPDAAAAVNGELTQTRTEHVVKTGLYSAINQNPQAGLAQMNSGKYDQYLDGSTREALETHAKVVERANAEQLKLNTAEQEKQRKADAKATENQIYASVIQPDGSVALGPNFYPSVIAAMQKYPDLIDGNTMVHFGQFAAEQAAKPEHIQTDPATYASFAQRAYLDDTDPHRLTMSEVVRARTMSLLSDSDFQHYADIVGRERKPEEKAEQKAWQQFVGSFKSTITKSSLSLQDGPGDQRYYEFQQNADRIMTAYKAAGKSLTDAQQAVRASIPNFIPSKADNRSFAQTHVLAPVVTGDKSIVIPKADVSSLPGYVDTKGGSAKVRRYNPTTGRIE